MTTYGHTPVTDVYKSTVNGQQKLCAL